MERTSDHPAIALSVLLRPEVLDGVDAESGGGLRRIGEAVGHPQVAALIGRKQPTCFGRKGPPSVGDDRITNLVRKVHGSDGTAAVRSRPEDHCSNIVAKSSQAIESPIDLSEIESDSIGDELTRIDRP